jgi:hypothetical protein
MRNENMSQAKFLSSQAKFWLRAKKIFARAMPKYKRYAAVVHAPDLIRGLTRASKADVGGIITEGAAWMPARPRIRSGEVMTAAAESPRRNPATANRLSSTRPPPAGRETPGIARAGRSTGTRPACAPGRSSRVRRPQSAGRRAGNARPPSRRKPRSSGSIG